LIDNYQAIIDHLPDVVYAKDLAGNILIINEQYTRISGMQPEQVIGKNQAELFPAEMVSAWQAADEQIINSGQATHTENIFYPDGTPHYYMTTQFLCHDKQHTPRAICAVSEDVTMRKQAEEQAKASQRLLQLIVDNMPLLVYVTDLEGNYTLVNRFAASLMHVEPQDIVGKNQSELFPPEVVEVWNRHNQQIVESGKVLEQEEPVEVPDGTRTNLSIKFPIFNDTGEIDAIGGISMDITDRKREEQERIAFQEEIIQAQRDFVRELSTPLMPIMDGVLVMPLIGRIDADRAQQVMETLLEGVAQHHAELAILDITGVDFIDTQVANALIQSAQAVRLLGATVVLSGISPQIAQTLVHLGVNFNDIVTCSTLQAGITYAMQQHKKG
jgi:anti-anti-sigma factor